MLFVFTVYVIGCLGMLLAGIVERRRHDANLSKIRTRVLVNGIRGKSSITRLCAGALRGSGLVTVAKTTGTAARFIHPDGSEEPVYRKFGIANVVEQIGIVRRAAAYRPDALVIECMAVMPDLQEINQSKLIRSTIGVLCNVREDHLAEMGPTLDDVARSLCRSMPIGGVCVTAERDRLDILREEAARRNCELIVVDPESVTDEEMAGFTWITFKENVAIALAVADLLGVYRGSALTGMWTAPPDPGVLSVERYRAGHKELRVANVFAANDPESTLMNIEKLLAQRAIERPLHLVINCRPDRVERNGQMGTLVEKLNPERVVLIGEPTRSARVTIAPEFQDRVADIGGKRPAREMLDLILDGVEQSASLVTIGNIHGQGELLLEELHTLEAVPASAGGAPRSQPPTPVPAAAHAHTPPPHAAAHAHTPPPHAAAHAHTPPPHAAAHAHTPPPHAAVHSHTPVPVPQQAPLGRASMPVAHPDETVTLPRVGGAPPTHVIPTHAPGARSGEVTVPIPVWKAGRDQPEAHEAPPPRHQPFNPGRHAVPPPESRPVPPRNRQ